MNPGGPFVGIDFGTSKSCISWFNPKTGEAEILRNAEGDETTPSVVYFGPEETLVGEPAIAMLDEDPTDQQRAIFGVKRDLVRAPMIAVGGGRRVKPAEAAAAIFAKLKRDAEELHFHEPVTRAVLTCPAMFDPLQREKIHEAAILAGLTTVVLLDEPVAAAIAYERAGLGTGNNILVYDLGGGTFDVAVLARDGDGTFRLAIPAMGLHSRGGDDLDLALYDDCEANLQKEQGRSISISSGHRDRQFLLECCKCKERLSTQPRCTLNAYLAPTDHPFHFKQTIERDAFEQMIGPDYIEPTVRLTQNALKAAQNHGVEVDTAVLVGGSSRVPLVEHLLKDALPVEPRKWQLQEVAVALGAAYEAFARWGTVEPVPRPVPPMPFPTPMSQRPAPAPMTQPSAALPPAQVVSLVSKTPDLEVDQSGWGWGGHRTIASAISAARPGNTILIRKGTYEEGLILDKPVNLVGNGALGGVIIRAGGRDVILSRADGGRIKNLCLQQRGGFLRSSGCGVRCERGSLTIEGCDITSKSSNCVRIARGASAVLRGNKIHDGKDDGVNIDGEGILEDNDIFANGSDGVRINAGGHATLHGNKIHDGKYDGVKIHGQGTVEDNDIFANGLRGVNISEGGHATLHANKIHDGKYDGVEIHGEGILEDNDIFANGSDGVRISEGGNATLYRNRITENKWCGLRVSESGAGTVEENDLRGNGGQAWDVKPASDSNVKRARNLV